MRNNFKALTYIFLIAVLLLVTNTYTWAQAPAVSGFTPASGPVGSTVLNITGSNFNTHADSNIIYFGAVRASVSSASATNLSAVVPPGALFQPFSILNVNDSLAGYSDMPFAVTFPSTHEIATSDFDPRVDFQLPSYSNAPNSVAIADFDGDGRPDIVMTQTWDSSVTVLRNVSSIYNINASSFVSVTTILQHYNNDVVQVADMDGDGKPDLVVMSENSYYTARILISVYRNTSTPGNISFAPEVDYIDSNVGTTEEGMTIGDIDNDGKPDVVVYRYVPLVSSGVGIYKNTSNGSNISFAPVIYFEALPINEGFNYLTLADLDGDGKLDVVGATTYGDSSLIIIKNTSTGGNISFANSISLPSVEAFNIAIGDIDGDGKPDIISSSNITNTASVYRNTSSAGAISFTANTDFSTNGQYPDFIAINDFDGDGKNDFITANANNQSVSVFRNTSVPGSITTSSFANPVLLMATQAQWGAAIGDLDGDGKPDIVTVSAYDILSVFRNDPAPIITPLDPSICDKGNITLSITPAGYYQWQADTGTGFFALSATATYNGVNTDSLTIFNADTSMNGYIYRCMVINSSITKYSRSDTLKVHVSPHPVIVNNTPYLSTGNYAAYQWNLNGAPVTAATNQHYTAAQNGSYTVYVTDSNGCSGMSDTVVVANASIANINAPVINIYPNPATEYVIIDAPIKVNVSVKDITGKEIMNIKNANEINIQQLPAGVYLISVFNQYGNILKTEKLLKTKND